MYTSKNTAWQELPRSVREAIEERVGPVTGSVPGGTGFSTDMRLILQAAAGKVFVKGIGPGGRDVERDVLELRAALAPYVPASPSLSFSGRAGGWTFSGWQAVEGRPASMAPGSDDVLAMAAALAEMGEIQAPDVPGLKTAGTDWGGGDQTLRGEAMLAHTDPHGGNFIITPGRTWMLDFGWAVRGPGWLTCARFIICLMQAGWAPADAEAVVRVVPAWRRADRAQVTAHAVAGVESWWRAYERGPAPQMWREVARRWADYRLASA